MTLTEDEKLRREEERKQKKFNETHKIINDVDHKLCKHCQKWFPSNTEYFYKKNNKVDGLDTNCKECTKIKTYEWQQENRDRFLKSKEDHRNNNNEYYKDYKRKWGKENRSIIRKRIKNWQQNNPEKIREYNKNREQHKKHKISKKEWNSCKEYFDNKCAYCGLPQEEHFRMYYGEMKNIDFHKEHVDYEGLNDLSNCVPSCQSCNGSKWVFPLEEWYNDENPNFTHERLDKINKWLKEDYLNI